MGCVQGWFPWAGTIASQVSSGSPTSSATVRVRCRWNRRRSPCNPSTRSSRFCWREKNQMVEIDDRTESQIWIILRSCRSLTCRNRSLSLWGWRPRYFPRARRTPGSRCTPGTKCSSSQRSSSFWSVCLGTAGTLSRTDLRIRFLRYFSVCIIGRRWDGYIEGSCCVYLHKFLFDKRKVRMDDIGKLRSAQFFGSKV